MDFNMINTPEELLDFMNKNIKYGFVDKNGSVYYNSSDNWYDECFVQTGEQVLNSRVGTCWDQVELERKWFEEHNFEIKTIFIWFEVDYENSYPSHTFLLYKKDNKWYWFENAFEDNRGIHELNSIEEAINYAISKQMEYCIRENLANPEDKKLIKSYEYSKLEKPLSVEKYLSYVTKGKEIFPFVKTL